MCFFFFYNWARAFRTLVLPFQGWLYIVGSWVGVCGELSGNICMGSSVWKWSVCCLFPRPQHWLWSLDPRWEIRSTEKFLCGNLQLLSPLLVPREVQIWQKSPEMLNSESIGANTDLSASVLFHSLRSSGFKTPRSQIKRCVIETTLLKADGCCSSHLFTCSFILLWKACLIQGSVVSSVGDTSLWGLFTTPRTCFTTAFSPLVNIKTPLRTEPFHKDWAPQRIVGLCEMFQAVLSEIFLFNLSVFIKRTFQAVPSPTRGNGGSCQGLVWHPLPICIRLGGPWAISICPFRGLCHGSGGMVLLLLH